MFFFIYLLTQRFTNVETLFDSLIYYVDQVHVKCPTYKICILSDFNRFSVSDLCNALNLSNIVLQSARKTAILDYCLLSKSIVDLYKAVVEAPIGNSDHNTIFINRRVPPATNKSYTLFHDYRESNIRKFQCKVSEINWKNLYRSIKLILRPLFYSIV